MDQRVEFLICGAQKAGTTALADYINLHPGLSIPKCKEVHFFDNEAVDWFSPDVAAYHRYFEEFGSNQLWGEATPVYMYWDESPRRIWQYNPKMKIIVMLRNPVSRAYSHWAMETERGAEHVSFDEAVEWERERCRDALPRQHRVFSYCDRGFYCAQLRRLWRFFGEEAVLILRQEDLLSNPEQCLHQVWRHLGVSSIESIKPIQRHLGHYHRPMNAATKSKLQLLFRSEIHQLEDMLGWDCTAWMES